MNTPTPYVLVFLILGLGILPTFILQAVEAIASPSPQSPPLTPSRPHSPSRPLSRPQSSSLTPSLPQTSSPSSPTPRPSTPSLPYSPSLPLSTPPNTLPPLYSSTSAQSPFITELLTAHNQYREEVGVPPLKWSEAIARSAQDWANELIATDSFAHSSSDYGENLWKGTAGQFTLTQMVERWGSERTYFENGVFPDISTTGNWSDVGHYTQLIWENTTEVGCAIATSNDWDILVCQYNPPGNIVGQRPF